MNMPDPTIINKLIFDAPTVNKQVSLLMRTYPKGTFAAIDELTPFHVALLTILADNLLVSLKGDVMIAVYRGSEQELGFTVFLGIQQGIVGIPAPGGQLSMELGLSGVSSFYPVPASIQHLPFEWEMFKCLSVDLIVAEYERTNGSND